MDSWKDSTIRYDIPIEINESDLFRYNPKGDFYNYICFRYNSEKGIDLTQYNKKKEFNERKMALCKNNCEFIEYKIDIKNLSLE